MYKIPFSENGDERQQEAAFTALYVSLRTVFLHPNHLTKHNDYSDQGVLEGMKELLQSDHEIQLPTTKKETVHTPERRTSFLRELSQIVRKDISALSTDGIMDVIHETLAKK